MSTHLRDADGVVHLSGALGDFMLCGAAPEGESGTGRAEPTLEQVTCAQCIAVVERCRRVREGDIAPRFKRRNP